MILPDAEYRALTESAGWLDLSRRGRLCLLGADREKFLHGQVTNDILKLRTGQGTCAALVNAKGRIESDLFVYKLADELLLDFEPGLTEKIAERLEHYVIAEDVQIVDVSPHFGLLSLQGPASVPIAQKAGFEIPSERLSWVQSGEIYVIKNSRLGSGGFDFFVPVEALPEVVSRLESSGALRINEAAAEQVRIEQGIPRFGIDMDETNLAPETGLERYAISYAKGCYIGQEIIARVRTYGQVAKALRVLRMAGDGPCPAKGARLFHEGKEVGVVTSFTASPKWGGRAGLGYLRKEANTLGGKVSLENGESVEVAGLPSAV